MMVLSLQTIDPSHARYLEKHASKAEIKYAVFCDAGSSGIRIKVYELIVGVHAPIKVSDVKELDVPKPNKAKPGLSAFADSVSDIGSYLDDLIDSAKKVVPADRQASTPIYLYATAGMRLLEDDEKNAVINEVNQLLSDESFSPFHFEKDFVKIISGQEEALYGWITVNFLKGIFSQKTSGGSCGALDLGGASTQNTFRTRKDSALVTFEPTLAGKTYPVFAHSYLSYGVNEARQSYYEYLVTKQGSDCKKIISHCHNDGYEEEVKINDKDYLLIGKYNGVLCKKAIRNKIFCNDPDIEECPFIVQPKLMGIFYGFSAIYYALNDVEMLKTDDDIVTVPQIKNSTDTFCAKPLEDVDTSVYGPDIMYGVCFQLNYIYELLKDGYNVHEEFFTLHVAKDLNGFELSWVLGAMLEATKVL
ncbi:ectonucleoside triphosphate diphosphohydrolase 1-like [Actinia tenebrosa]|uniref:Ectonucleoside triphosphate diphosphohydrolase 1-like n=1 Tax=Actinia tenebrosa TaxID=6105 RepID=A0A6P8IZV8_ACTTE|nr:ectonucleoside triphosphate diphosphohydrolase 1-like [Actinia tenebrosa]